MENLHSKIYSRDFYLSQSRLKNLLYGSPKGFLYKQSSGDSNASLLGKLVEVLLLEREDFNNKFKILDTSKPTAQMGQFVDYLLEYPSIYYKDLLTDAFNHVGVKRGSIEKFIERFEQEGKQYYDDMLEVIETKKMIVSTELLNKANELVTIALEDERFVSLLTEQKGLSFHVQDLIHFNYLGEKCIALPDIYIVNKKLKTIVLVDIKTTSKNILSAAKDSRWDIQAAFYKRGLEQKYPGFIVNKVYYYIIKTDVIQRPTLLELTEIDLFIGEYGTTIRSGLYNIQEYGDFRTYYEVNGFKQLVERFKWHRDNDEWELSREEVETGISQLNLFTGNKTEWIIKPTKWE